jgi:hypothetical protein
VKELTNLVVNVICGVPYTIATNSKAAFLDEFSPQSKLLAFTENERYAND